MLAIAIYPVGVFALDLLLLVHSRNAIRTKRPTVMSEATAFLHREYKPHLFWCACVVPSDLSPLGYTNTFAASPHVHAPRQVGDG